MAGKAKFAERMAKYLNEPVDAACPITRPGGTAGQIGGSVGGAVGAAISSVGKQRDSDVQVGQFAWLGLGADHFALAKASMMGKPTGDPLARVAYADVSEATLTEGKITMRVDLALQSGGHIAFEAKRHGQNKPSVEVLELLRDRCTRA
ncbi:MAG: hypothetical protein QOI95_1097 [Acidimicrobiaceae bacterium]